MEKFVAKTWEYYIEDRIIIISVKNKILIGHNLLI